MFRTLSDRIDIIHGSLEIVVHDNSAVNGNAGVFGKLSIRLNADSHHHEIRLQLRTITESQTVNPLFACQLNRLLAHGKLHALTFQFRLQH
ncbi:hypothetical protein D3C79_835560 [compost metagenome]